MRYKLIKSFYDRYAVKQRHTADLSVQACRLPCQSAQTATVIWFWSQSLHCLWMLIHHCHWPATCTTYQSVYVAAPTTHQTTVINRAAAAAAVLMLFNPHPSGCTGPRSDWYHPGHSGLAVTCLTAVSEDQGSNPIVGSSRFFVKTTTIYSLGHGLHTLTTVPRSTQPSNLRGMVKWVSAAALTLIAALMLIQPASKWTHWDTLWHHPCLSRAATYASSLPSFLWQCIYVLMQQFSAILISKSFNQQWKHLRRYLGKRYSTWL